MDGMKIFEYYKKRWNIEVFYRDCKQHLGMGEYQVRVSGKETRRCSYTPTPGFPRLYPPKK